MSPIKKGFNDPNGLEADLVNYYGEEAIVRTDADQIPIPGNPDAIKTIVAKAIFLKRQKKDQFIKPKNNPNDTLPSIRLLELLAKMEKKEAKGAKLNITQIVNQIQKKLYQERQRKIDAMENQNPDLQLKGLQADISDFFNNEDYLI
jgi:hypothetical protein